MKQIIILQVRGGIPNGAKCFPDDGVGNRQAEEYFSKLVKESREADLENLDTYLMEGIYENGDYEVYFIHEYDFDED